MSLFTLLGTSEITVVGAHLRDAYVQNQTETARRQHARLLDEFYEGRGECEMERVIDELWKHPKNVEQRKAIVRAGLDRYNNILARIANEKATVYSEPARRRIANDDELYQRFLDRVQMDDAMREADRKLGYHEDVLIGYRVRELPTGEREPVLDVVSPASFWAIAHPADRTLLIGVILDQRDASSKETDPSFRVWTDDQTFVMNGRCEIFETSIESWPLQRMPFVLATTRLPGSKQRLLAETPSADLLSAQKTLRLQGMTLGKESVSASKQVYQAGDTSAAAQGQQNDTNSDVMLPEGVNAFSLDRGIDLSQFRQNAEYVGDATGANHGLPPSVLHHRDASSGAEIQLRRIPIRQIRNQRIPVMRRVEARLARIMSIVNSPRMAAIESVDPQTGEAAPTLTLIYGDLPEFTFSDEGFSIDFGEVQEPLTEAERDSTFETRRRLGLTDNVEEEQRRNPDLKTEDEAKQVIGERLKRQTWFVEQQKHMQQLNGSAGSAVGEPTAQENGQAGAAAGSAP